MYVSLCIENQMQKRSHPDHILGQENIPKYVSKEEEEIEKKIVELLASTSYVYLEEHESYESYNLPIIDENKFVHTSQKSVSFQKLLVDSQQID